MQLIGVKVKAEIALARDVCVVVVRLLVLKRENGEGRMILPRIRPVGIGQLMLSVLGVDNRLLASASAEIVHRLSGRAVNDVTVLVPSIGSVSLLELQAPRREMVLQVGVAVDSVRGEARSFCSHQADGVAAIEEWVVGEIRRRIAEKVGVVVTALAEMEAEEAG
jgi:hypothetical protein